MTLPLGGNGDITDPNAWSDQNNHVPPQQLSNVPTNLNFPANGDGRYWWQGSANGVLTPNGFIAFIGNTNYYVGIAQLTWQVTQAASDGSQPQLGYSVDGGGTYTAINIQQAQGSQLLSGSVDVALAGCTGFRVEVLNNGGTPTAGAKNWQIAVGITRNEGNVPIWDFPNPLDPTQYNNGFVDNPGYDTLSILQTRLLINLGFSNQTATPPPGMLVFLTDKLQTAQNYLYRRYNQLRNKRFFRWKLMPGVRYYDLSDNDEEVLSSLGGGFSFDPSKTIDWVGIQDTRNVWYPMIEGIPPQLYTMLAKPWRPARYEIRQGIEVYPAPDQTYFLWIKGHFGLQPFSAPTDTTTIDSELVFLQALGWAKAHYGQQDAELVLAAANNLRRELISATHQSARYVPGTVPVPPAVRPTLIQFQDNQSG